MARTKVTELILKYEDGSEANVTFGLPASETESNGEWPSITEDGRTVDFSEYAQAFLLDAGAFHAYKGWDANDTVHLPDCDCPEMTIERAVNQAKREILLDVAQGRVPTSVATFAELHDYVDANCYGGLCDDDSEDADWFLNGFIREDEYGSPGNVVQNRLDQWIKAGALRLIPA